MVCLQQMPLYGKGPRWTFLVRLWWAGVGVLGKWKEKEILWLIFSLWILSGKNHLKFYLWSCFFIKLDTVSHWKKRRRSVIQKVEIDPKDLSVHDWRQRRGGPGWNEKGLGVAETCHPHDWRQRNGGPGWNEEGLGTVSRNLLEININRNLMKTQDPKQLLTHSLPIHTSIHIFGVILQSSLYLNVPETTEKPRVAFS